MIENAYGPYRFYVEPIASCLPEARAMWEAHWAEQREEEIRPGATLNPDIDGFLADEAAKRFVYITVRLGDDQVGHFGLKFGRCRQTSDWTSGDDFFYLKPEHRKGRLGINVINFARDLSFHLGSVEFINSIRVTGKPIGPLLTKGCRMRHIADIYSVRR